MGAYVPSRVDDPELIKIAQAISSPNDYLLLNVLYAAPARMLAGMIVYADGTSWNPGSGAGVYRRNAANSAWVFLG